MSGYYTIKKSEYDDLTKHVMELAAITMKLRAELDAERALNARLLKMNFAPPRDPTSYLPSECARQPLQGSEK